MNTVFKVVFNAATRAFTAVSEAAKSKHVSATVMGGVLVSLMGATFTNAAEATDGVALTTNKAGDLYVDKAGNSSNLHAVTGKVIVHDDAITDIVKRQDTQDQRGNEVSDRTYDASLTAKSSIHYDGDEVVKTDEDLKDTITGKVMTDRKGNNLKVRELETGSDSITFRGSDGASLKNVADGEVSNTSMDAVNGSQLSEEKASREKADSDLKTSVDTVNKSIASEKDRATSVEKSLQTQVTSKVDNAKYIKDTNKSNQRISDLEGTKASRKELSLVQTQAQSGIKKGDAAQKTANENRQMIKDEVKDRQAGDAQLQAQIDTKADAHEVNVSLETKVDTETFEADQKRQDDKLTANSTAITNMDTKVDNNTANLQGQIDTKISQEEFEDDQFRQDAQADADRTNTRKELNTKVNVDTYMNQLQTDQAKTAQAQASGDTANASVSRETTARETQFGAGVAAQAAINDQVSSETKRLDTVKADKNQVNAVIDSVDAVATETRAHGDKIQSLDSRTSAVETQTSANSNAINANAARQSDINEDVEARKADRSELKQAVTDQSKVNDKVAQVQTNHGQRINTLEDRQGNAEQAITDVNNDSIARDKEVLSDAKSYVDRTRGELNNRIDNVERKAYSGIAASMAMSGLSPVIHANKSAMAVSVGSYASQGAVAVGYSRRFGDDATTLRINGGVADRNFGGAVGITHEF